MQVISTPDNRTSGSWVFNLLLNLAQGDLLNFLTHFATQKDLYSHMPCDLKAFILFGYYPYMIIDIYICSPSWFCMAHLWSMSEDTSSCCDNTLIFMQKYTSKSVNWVTTHTKRKWNNTIGKLSVFCLLS